MKGLKVNTDLIIGVGLCIALIISIIKGVSAEIITCIVGNLGGYMGRSLMSEHLSATNTPVSTAPSLPAIKPTDNKVKGAE